MTTVRACLLVVLSAWLAAIPTAAAPPDTRAESTFDVVASATGAAAGSSAKAPRPRVARARATRTRSTSRSGASSNVVRRSGRQTSAAEPSAAPLRILFIGNSHTHRNGGMEWLVSNLVASEDPPRAIEAERRTESAVTLEYHYRNGALQAIREGDWDIVVLQEYLPGIPSQSAEPFSLFAGLLDAAIRDSGARTVLYMTWPDAAFPWAGLDDFIAAFRRVSAEIDAPVAPVGLAMERAHAQRPDLEFLGPDQVHTTWEGAYLAAATIYATLFERSPEGLAYHLGISDEDAAFLQRIAWETARDWQAESGHPYMASGGPAASGGPSTASRDQPAS